MVTLNVVNPIGAGMRLDGLVADMWKSLTDLHNVVTNLGLLHAEEELNSIKYVPILRCTSMPCTWPTQKSTAREQRSEMQSSAYTLLNLCQ